MTTEQQEFLSFLIEAKQKTYAAEGDDATIDRPLLPGSRQLDYRTGDWLYRDIYFGMAQFSGHETVYRQNNVYWAMVYAGGVIAPSSSGSIGAVYGFLRTALMRPDPDLPARGPVLFRQDEWLYRNEWSGTWSSFHGTEEIFHHDRVIYRLTYGGGLIR